MRNFPLVPDVFSVKGDEVITQKWGGGGGGVRDLRGRRKAFSGVGSEFTREPWKEAA